MRRPPSGKAAERQAGAQSGHLIHRRALGDEQLVERVGDGRPGDGHAVAAHDEHACAVHGLGQAVALGVVAGGSVATLVDPHPVVQQQIVVVGQRQLWLLQQRQRGQVLRMDMQHAGGGGVAQVDAGVDVEGHLAQLAGAAQHAALQVADDEVACGQLLEQQAARVDQELLGLAGHSWQHERVVVADLLVPAMAGGDAEHGSHVAAHLPLGGGHFGAR